MATPRFLSASQGIVSVAVPASAAMFLGAWLDGPALWLVAGLLVVAVAPGSVACLVGIDPRGVPVEASFLPSVAALGGLGVAHLGGQTPLALVGVALGGASLAMSIVAERSLALHGVIAVGPSADVGSTVEAPPAGEVRPEPEPEPTAAATGPRARSLAEWRVLAVAVPITFLGMIGVIGLADRGFVAGLPSSGSPSVAGSAELVVVMIGAAFVAAAVGYRIGATDTPDVGEVLWMAAGYGLLAAVVVIGLRVGSVPVLSWPGVLTAVVYLWGVYHRLLDPVDTTARRLLDLLIVGGATLLAVAAQLRAG